MLQFGAELAGRMFPPSSEQCMQGSTPSTGGTAMPRLTALACMHRVEGLGSESVETLHQVARSRVERRPV